MHKEKLDVTIAKAIAIVLVVVGHIMAGGTSEGNEWFSRLVDYIYLFHMPFFIFISGYLFFKKGRVERLANAYKTHISNQAIRLILPFFFMGAFIVTGKIVMSYIVHVDNIPDNVFAGFINLVWHTKHSASEFLWYIFVLFIYGAITPLLYLLFRDNMKLWLILGVALFAIPPIDYFYLDKLTFFFLFFVFGGIARKYEDQYLKIISDYRAFIILLALFIGSFILFENNALDYKFNKLITGSLSIPVLHQLCVYLVKFKTKSMDAVMYLGQCSYVIYLFNTICIGLTKAVLFKFINWDFQNFYIVAPILIAAGILGPLIAQWLILKRIPFVKDRILGL